MSGYEGLKVQDSSGSQATAIRKWFAVYTSNNHEKKVEQHLRMRDIETFLPLHTVSKKWQNRVTARVEFPLFPGYVFVKIARNQTAKVLDVALVHFIVGNGREALALPDAEVEILRVGLRQRQVDPHPYLKVGDLARIRCGPLAGLQGVVLRKDGQLRIVLSVDAISKSIAVHVTAEELEPYG